MVQSSAVLHVSESDAESSSTEGPVRGGDQLLRSWPFAIVITSLYLGTLLVAIDTTIISVAVPKISTVFNALDDVGWYGSAYLLTVTACQPSFGKVYKLFNVKSVYLASIVIFEVGSILCAAAPTSPAFIIGRAIAGIGAAGLYQGALAIIGLTCPLEKRPFYIALVLSVFGIAVCVGPLIGGVLTDRVSWRWCFWINAPIGFVAFILILAVLKLKDAENAERRMPMSLKLKNLDIIGGILVISAVCCLLLALQWGGSTYAWDSARVIGLFVGFGLLIITFVLVQWQSKERATIPLRLLRQRSVIMAAWFLFFLEMSIYVDIYYIPFYFQAVQGVSVTASGVRAIPLGLSQIVAVMVVGAIVTKTGHYVPYIVIGTVISIIGTGFLSTIELGTRTVVWAALLVITGWGLGMGLQLPFTALQVVLCETDLPLGNAILIFFSQLGAAIAIAIGQSVLVNSLLHEIPKRTAAIQPQAVIANGALDLQHLTDSTSVLKALREAYAKAIQNLLVYSLVAVCVALPFAVSMQWLNVKKAAKDAKARDTDSRNTEAPLSVELPQIKG